MIQQHFNELYADDALITNTFTETTTIINTTTITETSVSTTTSQSSLQQLSIDLVTIQENKAASWSNPHLTVLVFPNNTLTNINNLEMVNVVKSSIDQWYNSILIFTKNYPQYSYLSQLEFTFYMAGVNDSLLHGAPNIEIYFVEDIPSSLIGETKLLISDLNFIQKANITITTNNLTLMGIQNVLTHELGHVFGLEHSFTEHDLMYFERDKNEVIEKMFCPSTLDIFAVALLYHWIETASYHPYYTTSVTLPNSIPYDVLDCKIS